MAIFDRENMFSMDQAITVTANSTDVIDLGAEEVGKGEHLELNILITEDFAAVGAATLVIKLETDDNSSFTSAKSLGQTDALAKDALVVGYQIPFHKVLPLGAERYVRLSYTVATGPMTAGKIWAGLNLDRQSNDSF